MGSEEVSEEPEGESNEEWREDEITGEQSEEMAQGKKPRTKIKTLEKRSDVE